MMFDSGPTRLPPWYVEDAEQYEQDSSRAVLAEGRKNPRRRAKHPPGIAHKLHQK